jgi:hypothetical protein
MNLVILIFGALILLAGIIIVINPDAIFGLLRNNSDKPVLHVLAVVTRLVLGLLLISQSNVSKFPFVIEVIGWLSVIAALAFAVMGRNNFNRIISWALSLVKPVGRIGGVLATLFGTFLVYAFI